MKMQIPKQVNNNKPPKGGSETPVLALLSGNTRFLAVVMLILISFFINGCKKEPANSEANEENSGKPVRVTAPRKGTMQPVVSFTGTIIPVNQIDVYSKIPGRVANVLVKEGDQVSEGDVLIELENEELSAQVRQMQGNLEAARTQLARAKTGYILQDTQVAVGIDQSQQSKIQAVLNSDQAKFSMENAKLDRDRMRRLFNKGAISKQTLENAELRYDTAKKHYDTTLSMIKQANESVKLAQANTAMKEIKKEEIEAADAQVASLAASLDLARVNLKNSRILAPISGVVTLKKVEKGEIVTGMPSGSPLIQIVDNSRINLEGEVGEGRVEDIKTGDLVNVTLDSFPKKIFKGYVETIISAADVKTRGFRVKVSIPNEKETLKSGMFGRASVLKKPIAGLLIPRPALLKSEEGYYLFVRQGRKAKKITVKVGTFDENEAIIVEGLSPDEEVVSTGQENLQNNEPIIVIRGT